MVNIYDAERQREMDQIVFVLTSIFVAAFGVLCIISYYTKTC
jgi:hypothetical protein